MIRLSENSTTTYRKYDIDSNYNGVQICGTIILELLIDKWVLKTMLLHPQRTKFSSNVLNTVLSYENIISERVYVYTNDPWAAFYFKNNNLTVNNISDLLSRG